MHAPKEFFQRPVDEVARDLIGRTLNIDRNGRAKSAIIVETEAYGGVDDLASHAAFRPNGGARVMRERGGVLYVYLAYGMYPCLNVVTGSAGEPGAVLIRGALIGAAESLVSGPGRLGRELGISIADNGQSCLGGEFLFSTNRRPFEIDTTPRIGITRAVDTPWRFLARLN